MPTNRKVAAVPDERKAIYESFIRPAISPHPYEDDGRGSTENLIDNILTARREAAAEATEQAAKVAMTHFGPTNQSHDQTCTEIAAAIRAQSLSPSASGDRESIVAWLRGLRSDPANKNALSLLAAAETFADAIERADDRKGASHDG